MRSYTRSPVTSSPHSPCGVATPTAAHSWQRSEAVSSRLPAALPQGLSFSKAGDALEQEADRLAGRVLSMAAPSLAPSAPESEDSARDARRPSARMPDLGGVSALTGHLGAAQPLDPASRAFFERRFGHDFGRVRVFNGSEAAATAAAFGARAFTLGTGVAFADGEYPPRSPRGVRLLAHELTHVVQQSAADPLVAAARDRSPPLAVQHGHPGVVYRAEPEASAQPAPERLPFEQAGNEAGAAGARHAATQLESLVSGEVVRRALAGIPITDAKQKQIVIDHVLNAPATLRAIADANKVRSLSSQEYETGKAELGFPGAAAAFADAGNDFLYVTPHGAPSAFTMGHEVSHIQTGPVSSSGTDAALSFALGNVNTEVRAAFVDYAIIKLGDLHKNLAGGATEDAAIAAFEKDYSSRIFDYVARHGSVKKALGKLAVVVAEQRGAESVPTNTTALKQAVAKGFVAESDLVHIFSREISPFDVEPEPLDIEGL